MILLLPTLSGKKKRHRVKYGLDYLLDHILDHVLDHFMGGGNTPLVPREGCDAVYRDSPLHFFRAPTAS